DSVPQLFGFGELRFVFFGHARTSRGRPIDLYHVRAHLGGHPRRVIDRIEGIFPTRVGDGPSARIRPHYERHTVSFTVEPHSRQDRQIFVLPWRADVKGVAHRVRAE